MSARRPYLCGNWKMHLGLDEALALADAVKRRVGRLRSVDVGLAPSFPFLAPIAKRLEGERVLVGAQDVHAKTHGAYTGQVSAAQVKSTGATFTLVGHSERRHGLGESDALVAEKTRGALAAGLDVMVCVGETLAERDGGTTFAVCERQVRAALDGLDDTALARITLAYEPVWAIGTGRTASPAQAQEVHRVLRGVLSERFGAPVGATVRILYGGSVKADNARQLLEGPDVDGALVGGASLELEAFLAIVNAGVEVATSGRASGNG